MGLRLRLFVTGLRLSGGVAFPERDSCTYCDCDIIVCLLLIVYFVVDCFVHSWSLVWPNRGFRISANCIKHAVMWLIGNTMQHT